VGKILLLVESPTKAKKIQSFLGSDYIVKATFGHMVDLPLKDLGVDLETMEEEYTILESKGSIDYQALLTQIRKLAQECEHVLIGSDPDREGEAIAWHVTRLLKLQPNSYDRIEIKEITPKGVKDAMVARRKVDLSWVDAQRARRVVDRLMGYGISPVLMRAVENGRSAGRVQSAALRMIVERDRAIDRFRPENRYGVEANFEQMGVVFTSYMLETAGVYDYAQPLQQDDVVTESSTLEQISSKKRKKRFVSSESVEKLVAAVSDVPDSEWAVIAVGMHPTTVKPKAPLTTSTLQQLGSRRFQWSGEHTMRVAQKLFEHGHITYMRTDSVRIEPDAQEEARAYLAVNYGVDMVPSIPNEYKNKDGTQDAHEAIRPTHLEIEGVNATIESDKMVTHEDAATLYDAIKEVFLCSQSAPGINNVTVVVVEDTDTRFQFEQVLTVWHVAGWRAISKEEPKQSGELRAKIGTVMCKKVESKVTKTTSKPRYKEDTLIMDLERNGVGRPSSFAGVMKTLKSRSYTTQKSRDIISTELGRNVTDWLCQKAAHYTDIHYTAQMEDRLDRVSAGKEARLPLLEEIRDDLRKVFNAFVARGNGDPSPKQKDFMEKLRAVGQAVPESAFETMLTAKAFLDSYMASRGPSEKQVEFALQISSATNLEYTDTMRMSAQKTKKFLDDAVTYAKKNNIRTSGGTDREATPKQIEMAKKLSAERKLVFDDTLCDSIQRCSAFIDESMKLKPASGSSGYGSSRPDREATPKQIEMAKKLAKEHKVPYIKEYENSMQKTSAFLDKYMKKK
jgi:DNA topoisomerase-1